MIDMTKKYRTASGLDVDLITRNGRGIRPIVGYVGDSYVPTTWDQNGENCDDGLTLVEVKEPKVLKCWVNFYEDGHASSHETQCRADFWYLKYNNSGLTIHSKRIGEAVEVTKIVEEE